MGYLGTGFSEWWVFWVLDFFGFRFNGLGIWDLVFIKSQVNRFLGQTIFRFLVFFWVVSSWFLELFGFRFNGLRFMGLGFFSFFFCLLGFSGLKFFSHKCFQWYIFQVSDISGSFKFLPLKF